ncbi:interleukin-12 subunit beta isoform X2 [Anabas testudineus]|uniref:interleukin-12 subunit beta isoform X2 n=1 Tax=Anabas testudineus TaxID=64144 RepID=UPI000E45E86F|nr:interleukin-12 subunit beta isoform X2 [Anabas testudineus]
MKTTSLWIFAVLFVLLAGANELFPENFKVVKGNGAVTLTCGTKNDGDVIWKFSGGSLDALLNYSVDKDTQNLILSEVETPMLGEYSCWRGGEMISSTNLLEEEEESEEEGYFNCSAKSYDCSFTCDWTRFKETKYTKDTKDTKVRLGLGHDCSEGKKSCNWVTSHQLVNGRFQFEISHSVSPYAEESTMLEVTAEAIIHHSFLRKTKRFYLRDIVQPDSPKIVRYQETDHHLHVTIDPPSSWSTPHSFFRLEHEIEYILRDNSENQTSSSPLIPKKISQLRVRSRDALVHSHWSQWSRWKNVTY